MKRLIVGMNFNFYLEQILEDQHQRLVYHWKNLLKGKTNTENRTFNTVKDTSLSFSKAGSFSRVPFKVILFSKTSSKR